MQAFTGSAVRADLTCRISCHMSTVLRSTQLLCNRPACSPFHAAAAEHSLTAPLQELCGCSRLVGLHCLLYTFNACLEDYLDEDPDFEQAPPDCLPALRSLSLRATEYDRHAGHGLRPIIRNELSALTGLTSLHIEGEPFNVRDYMSDNDSAASDRIEDYALRMHQETEPSVVPPSRAFCLPHLRQLSLVSCGFEAVPDFVAGVCERQGCL